MQFRLLGNSGLRVSVYGLGTNSFGARADESTSIRIIHHALDSGVNLIDTADRYNDGESERIIGIALRGRRQQAILATKCGMRVGEGPNDGGSSRLHIMRQVEASLRRLQTDYIDLYQIHTFDPATPLEETLSALDDLVRQGKVRYLGCSNYAAWQLCKALWISDRRGLTRFHSAQHPYSAADRRIEQELIPLCLDQGVGIFAYYPLAGGLLTGKYQTLSTVPPSSRAAASPSYRGQISAHGLELAQRLQRVASNLGVPTEQLALRWAMDQPGITSVLVGATSVAQQEQNLQAIMLQNLHEALKSVSDFSKTCIIHPALPAPWFPIGLVDGT